MTVRRSMQISITESLKPTLAQTWVSPNRSNGIADILQIFPACISPLELPYTVWWVWARAVSDCIHATPRSHTLQDNTAGRCCSSDTRWDVTSSHNAFSMCLGHGVYHLDIRGCNVAEDTFADMTKSSWTVWKRNCEWITVVTLRDCVIYAPSVTKYISF